MCPLCVHRLHHLESRVMEDVGKPSEVVCDLKSEVESFKRKLEVFVSVQKIQPQNLTRILGTHSAHRSNQSTFKSS